MNKAFSSLHSCIEERGGLERNCKNMRREVFIRLVGSCTLLISLRRGLLVMPWSLYTISLQIRNYIQQYKEIHFKNSGRPNILKEGGGQKSWDQRGSFPIFPLLTTPLHDRKIRWIKLCYNNYYDIILYIFSYPNK